MCLSHNFFLFGCSGRCNGIESLTHTHTALVSRKIRNSGKHLWSMQTFLCSSDSCASELDCIPHTHTHNSGAINVCKSRLLHLLLRLLLPLLLPLSYLIFSSLRFVCAHSLCTLFLFHFGLCAKMCVVALEFRTINVLTANNKFFALV